MAHPARRLLIACDEETRLGDLLAALPGTRLRASTVGCAEASSRLEREGPFDALIVAFPCAEADALAAAENFAAASPGPALAILPGGDAAPLAGRLRAAGVRHVIDEDTPREELLLHLRRALFPVPRARGQLRLPVSFGLSLAAAGGRRAGQAYDLTEEGLFLETESHARPGESLELEFELPVAADSGGTPTAIQALGEVMWSGASEGDGDAAPVGLGVRFTDIDRRSREAISGYVRDVLRQLRL